MLDRYLWGDVERISPEAPVPVFRVKDESEMVGGAGNVGANLVGLGAKVTIVSLRGADSNGDRLMSLFERARIDTCVFRDSGRPTSTKTRVISRGQQLVRIDLEETSSISQEIQKQIRDALEDMIPEFNVVVLSDYGKGVLEGAEVTQTAIRLSGVKGLPVLVDPKGTDWERYCGATCVTPNTKELEAVFGRSLRSKGDLVDAMRSVISRYGFSWLLVTRGPLGMCLMSSKEKAPIFIPSIARQVYDVSGAGDTAIATLAAAIGSGLYFPDAAKLANLAAGIVVGKVGTQPITVLELQASLAINEGGLHGRIMNKINALQSARVQIQAWKANGEQIVFTNGCFDLLHPGHIHLLTRAKELGDRLVVGLNSDASVRRLKGPNRPILSERDRASLLASLDCVDLVVLFQEDTPELLIETLRPNILVKGADYRPEEVVGRAAVESYGGEVRLIPLLPGYSTTAIATKVGLADGSRVSSD